jgi:DNA-binding transcriptional LysR family regulator
MEELWDDDFVGVMRRGHPLAKHRLTLERFAAASHVLVAPTGQPGSFVEDALAKHGLSRRIVFRTPSFLVAPQVVAATDLLLIAPARIAAVFAKPSALLTFAPPIDLPGFRIAMFWHERHDAEPAHRFVRGEIARVAAALPEPPRPSTKAAPRKQRSAARRPRVLK